MWNIQIKKYLQQHQLQSNQNSLIRAFTICNEKRKRQDKTGESITTKLDKMLLDVMVLKEDKKLRSYSLVYFRNAKEEPTR